MQEDRPQQMNVSPLSSLGAGNRHGATEFREVATAPVTRAVVWNQALWMAGYSLTSGGFLTYFGRELGAAGLLMAVLLVVPETAATLGLLTRWVVQKLRHRKGIWIGFTLTARGLMLLVPLMAFPALQPAFVSPLIVMAAVLAVASAVQTVAYLSYLSWLSDLVPERQWGRFFALRNIAKVSVLLVVPVVGGYLRDWWRREVPADEALWAYAVAFVIGTILQVISLWPLLSLPDLPVRSETVALPELALLQEAWRNRSMRYLLLHNWWLALFNGLTQAAFFLSLIGPLKVGLGTYYVLSGLMRLVKIPVSWGAGKLCDRGKNKQTLIAGVLTASSALLFWLAATPQRWWLLFGAFALWGAFAAANIAGRNLALLLSPRSDNTAHLALFRQIGGLLAGLSGLAGGIWLDHLQKSGFTAEMGPFVLDAFALLFLVSLLGRWTSVLWLIPLREPPATDRPPAQQTGVQASATPSQDAAAPPA